MRRSRRALLLGASARLSGTILAGAVMQASEVAAEVRPGALVVIGDSLSDNGNAGRFSNGPVWVEAIAARLGIALTPSRLGGTNYAIGGALTHGGPGDLRAQADLLLARHGQRLDRDGLFVVWGAGNDLLAAVHRSDADRSAYAAAAALTGIVDDLAAAGATQLVVPNLPNIGMTPALRAQGPAMMAAARRLTRAFDDALAHGLDELESRRRDLRIVRFDVWTLAERALADPAAFGFRNVAEPCRSQSCDGYLFWDDIHPTTAAHARLADAALRELGLPDKD